MLIEHISINIMIPDPLTKGVNPKVFSEHVEMMSITESIIDIMFKFLGSLCI